MADPYPPSFEIEIDRSGLKRFLRTSWLISSCIFLALFGFFFGLMACARELEARPKPTREALVVASRDVAIGLGLSILAALALDRLLLRRIAAHYAASLQVSVEGSFLRIREDWGLLNDRRLHFRAIVDYSLQQTWIGRWCNVESLVMNTTGSGPKSTVTIAGVKGGLQTRDLLSEVDRLRENSP